jgi:hypothetical protein
MSLPTISLNDGNQIPILAFGTGSKFKGKASFLVLPNYFSSTLLFRT